MPAGLRTLRYRISDIRYLALMAAWSICPIFYFGTA
jgi:hypothetical protein